MRWSAISQRTMARDTPVRRRDAPVARRAGQWEERRCPDDCSTRPTDTSGSTLVDEWRANPDASDPVPRRSPADRSSALIDPAARRLTADLRWGFPSRRYVGGARPGESDLVSQLSPPRWMLDRGWALGAEVAGVTERDDYGPHRQPSVAWVRSDPGEVLLMIGGRHLGGSGDPTVRVSLRANGRPLAPFDGRPGLLLQGDPDCGRQFPRLTRYVPLEVTSESAAPGTVVPVGTRAVRPAAPGSPMTGVEDGWHEPEYNPLTARAWRWSSERATIWVRPVGRDVTLVLEGESPLRYFDAAPVVTVTAAGRQVGRFSPTADFKQEFVVPADALDAASGRVAHRERQVVRAWRPRRDRRPASPRPQGLFVFGEVIRVTSRRRPSGPVRAANFRTACSTSAARPLRGGAGPPARS